MIALSLSLSLWVSDGNALHPKIEKADLKEVLRWDNKGKGAGASYNWYKNNSIFWQQLKSQLPNLDQLYFADGESTIIEERYQLLGQSIELGCAENIRLRYNSNGMELPQRLFKF